MLLAFHDDPKVKKKYLARVAAHKAADEIIHGEYVVEEGNKFFKGCAVGCTIHSAEHQNYEKELGIPTVLARLEDKIFESLNHPRDTEWPHEFLEAIPVGADLSNVWPQYVQFLLVDTKYGVINFTEEDGIRTLINEITQFYRDGKFAKKEHLDEIENLRQRAFSAYAAPYADASAATHAAAYAAAAAHAAAYADGNPYIHIYIDADVNVDSAARAYAAAYAAAYADTDPDVRKKWHEVQADKLLKLLRAAPIGELLHA